MRGWLYLTDKLGSPAFSEADERFTVTLTQAVVFYENARLYADLQGHAAALEQEIADRKRAESERAEMLARAQAAQAEAEEANRLKDEFLATVSHELRAPLNAMLGWVTLAREGRLDEASVWAPSAGLLEGTVVVVDRPGCGLTSPVDYRGVDYRRHAADWLLGVVDG